MHLKQVATSFPLGCPPTLRPPPFFFGGGGGGGSRPLFANTGRLFASEYLSVQKARGNADTGSIPRCGKRFFSQSRKPGAMVTWVRFPRGVRDFSPRVNFQHRLLQCLCSSSVQLHASNICVHVKNPKQWQPPYRCLDTKTHYILVGMGSCC